MTVVSNSTGNQIRSILEFATSERRVPVAKSICYLRLATAGNNTSAEPYCLDTANNEKPVLIIKDEINPYIYIAQFGAALSPTEPCAEARGGGEDDTGFILES